MLHPFDCPELFRAPVADCRALAGTSPHLHGKPITHADMTVILPCFPLPFVRCGVCCCGAVAPGVTAALLGRFLPRLGPLAVASGPFFQAIVKKRFNPTAIGRGRSAVMAGHSASEDAREPAGARLRRMRGASRGCPAQGLHGPADAGPGAGHDEEFLGEGVIPPPPD